MGKVTIRFNNPSTIVRNARSAWNGNVLPVLSEQIISDCNTYVRKQDGTLADSVDRENGGRRITWNTAYAKRVYYTGTPRTNVNPNASLRWCEVSKRADIKDWERMANALMKGG